MKKKTVSIYDDGRVFWGDGMTIGIHNKKPTKEIELKEDITKKDFDKIKNGKYTQKDLDKLTKKVKD